MVFLDTEYEKFVFDQNHKLPRPNPDGSNKLWLLLLMLEEAGDGRTDVEYPVLVFDNKWDDNIDDATDDEDDALVVEGEVKNMDFAILDLSFSSVGQLTRALLAAGCSVPVEVAAILLNIYFICGI